MSEMENPFKFGRIVTGEDFVDRDKEIEEIIREVRSGVNVVLYSPRRMGKSSLLMEMARRYRGELLFVYVDLYGVATKGRMVEAFMSALVRSTYGTVQKVASGFKDMLRGSRFRLVIGEGGEPGIELAMAEPTLPEIQEVLDLPEEIGRKKGKRVVVMFDEFQEIGSLDGVALLKTMRSRFQTHRHVSYVFAGSKKHLLFQIFEEREGAFFKSARALELGPIPPDDFVRFMIDKFDEFGGDLDDQSARAVVQASRGNSYYAQQIAHELFAISEKPRWPEDFEESLSATLAHQAPAFSYIWDSIKSQMQKRYLDAVAHDPDSKRGVEFIERHRLKSHSNLQKVIKQLDAKGLTEKGDIVDPMFALWLRRLQRQPHLSG